MKPVLWRRLLALLGTAALVALLWLGAKKLQPASNWWGRGWGLPTNFAVHGDSADTIFWWIFWITSFVFVFVQVLLVWFAIKYREQPGRKAVFLHGHTRLEIVWTVIPAIIFAVLVLVSIRSWNEFRYGNETDKNPASILVIAEQFQWNVVYPGHDGELGQYLIYPKLTDKRWPKGSENFREVAGPAATRPSDSVDFVNAWVAANPLGQDLASPHAEDDDPQTPARAVIVPAERSVRIYLTSRDVIHDFFLPNFRVKLDAVPGMRGLIPFTIRKEAVSTQEFNLSDANFPVNMPIWLNQETASTDDNKNYKFTGNPSEYQIMEPHDKKHKTSLLRNMDDLNKAARKRVAARDGIQFANVKDDQLASVLPELKQDLITAGFTKLKVVVHPYEIVCEQLCGANHDTMRGDFYVLSQHDYELFINRYYVAPTTQPAVASTADTAPLK